MTYKDNKWAGSYYREGNGDLKPRLFHRFSFPLPTVQYVEPENTRPKALVSAY